MIGLILVIIGLAMLLIYWPTWPTGVALIAVGLLVVGFFVWAYRRVFTDKMK
jgi:hypothetical protein